MTRRPQSPHPGPADWFTLPGRLLLVVTLIGCMGLFYWYFMSTAESLPAAPIRFSCGLSRWPWPMARSSW